MQNSYSDTWSAPLAHARSSTLTSTRLRPLCRAQKQITRRLCVATLLATTADTLHQRQTASKDFATWCNTQQGGIPTLHTEFVTQTGCWTRHFDFRCTEPWRPDSPDDLPVHPVHLSQSSARQVLLLSLMLGGVYAADETHETRRRLVEAILRLPVDQYVRLATLLTQAAPCDLVSMFSSFMQHAQASITQESGPTERLPQTFFSASPVFPSILGGARRYVLDVNLAYNDVLCSETYHNQEQKKRPGEPNRPGEPRTERLTAKSARDELHRSSSEPEAANRSVALAGVVSGVMPGTSSARAVTLTTNADSRQTWRPSLWTMKNSPPKALTDMVL